MGYWLFFLSTLFVALQAQATTVTLHEKSWVKSHRYQLSDIATIEGPHAKQLRDVIIGQSPRPGRSIDLKVQQIKAKLYQSEPNLIDDIKWQGKQVTSIKTLGKKIALDRIRQLADETINTWLKEKNYTAFQWQRLKEPKAIMIPEYADVTFDAHIPSGIEKANKRMGVWVDVLIDQQQYHSYQVWYQVSAMQEVYTSRYELSATTRIEPDMLNRQIIDVTNLQGIPVTKKEQWQNKRLLTQLMTGDALVSKALTPITLVTKGDWVEVTVKSAGVSIKTKGVALKNGNYQEKIPVLNPTTNNSYLAVITDDRQVRVD